MSFPPMIFALAADFPLMEPTYDTQIGIDENGAFWSKGPGTTFVKFDPNGATPDATASVKGKVKLANAFGGTADAPTSLGFNSQAELQTFVEGLAAAPPDATTSVKGRVKLAGSLGGTADLPTSLGLASSEEFRQIKVKLSYRNMHRGMLAASKLSGFARGVKKEVRSDLDRGRTNQMIGAYMTSPVYSGGNLVSYSNAGTNVVITYDTFGRPKTVNDGVKLLTISYSADHTVASMVETEVGIVYCDPSSAQNGDGTLPTPAAGAGQPGARNTWSGYTITAGKRLRTKRGTTSTAMLRPQGLTASQGAPTVIEAYYNADGSDDPLMPRPVFDHAGGSNGVGAIFVDTCQHVVVRSIAATNSKAAGGAAVRIRRSKNVEVFDCEGWDNTFGCTIVQDEASATSMTADILIHGNDFHHNTGSGIHFQYGAVATATIKRLTIDGNRIWENGWGDGSSPRGGIMSQNMTVASTTTDYAVWDVVVTNNEVYKNRSYAINVYGARAETLRYQECSWNHIYENGYDETLDTHGLWIGAAVAMLALHNHIHHNYGWLNGTIGTGVGIFLDFNSSSNVGCVDCHARYNHVHDQWQGTTQSILPGSGIHMLSAQDCTAESNLVERCRNGITSQSTGFTGNRIWSNTVVDCGNLAPAETKAGYGLLAYGGETSIKQNVVLRGRSAIFMTTASISSGSVETHNCAFGSTVTPKSSGTTLEGSTPLALDGTSITTDPLLDEEFVPKLASPIRKVGPDLTGSRTDFTASRRNDLPSWGAFE